MERQRTIIDHADDAFEMAEKTKDPVERTLYLRQAAEKAWVHVTENIDKELGIPDLGDQTGLERIRRLKNLGQLGEEISGPYHRIRAEMHGKCFYNSQCDITTVRKGIADAKEIVNKLARAKSRRR